MTERVNGYAFEQMFIMSEYSIDQMWVSATCMKKYNNI